MNNLLPEVHSNWYVRGHPLMGGEHDPPNRISRFLISSWNLLRFMQCSRLFGMHSDQVIASYKWSSLTAGEGQKHQWVSTSQGVPMLSLTISVLTFQEELQKAFQSIDSKEVLISWNVRIFSSLLFYPFLFLLEMNQLFISPCCPVGTRKSQIYT